jgi:NAD(P)-dependent dehydrogenase (short-subunit alcohol dehydrogenase family)
MTTKTTSAPKVWFVTGCSTGFGAALVDQLLERGEYVFATARRTGNVEHFLQHYPKTCKVARLDVRDSAAISSAVAEALAWQGRIDVCVNNAGYGLVGAVEEVTDQEVSDIFETNVFGVVKLLRAVLPAMRARKAGHIINISSMGGLVGFPGMALYSASKFAVEGLSEGLAQELAPFDIKLTLVEPGPFRTRFRGGLLHAGTALDAYAETVGKIRLAMADPQIKPPGDPVRAAKAIIEAASSAAPPLHLPLGQICYDKVESKLRALQSEMATWKDLALATSFTEESV